MDDNKKEQLEALGVLAEFNDRLVKNMKIVSKELAGNRLEDTDQFLKSIIDAINWEIQVVNGTLDVLNQGKERLNKDDFNAYIVSLNNAINSKDDIKLAEEFSNTVSVFEQLGISVKEVIS